MSQPDNFISEHPKFHRYVEIEDATYATIPDGTLVMVTEKLDGLQCRIGVIDGEVVAGSRTGQVKHTNDSLYWTPLAACRQLLSDMQEDGVDIILFGELYGPGCQPSKYDVDTPTFSCFDISCGGEYLPAILVMQLCAQYHILHVPVLEIGTYTNEFLTRHTHGKSLIASQPREGIVIKALEESNPRQIVKSISNEFVSRDLP